MTFIFFVKYSLCQTFTIAGASVGVSSNAILAIDGNATNNGSIQNNGSITVSGDWTNTGTFQPQNGIFILNGNKTQKVSHNNQSFYVLEINGSAEKIFTSDADVLSKLNLINGLVTTNVNLIIRNSAVITGGSDNSHINGKLFNEGLGQKFFPIGKNGIYRPVTLNNIVGTNPVLGLEVKSPNNNTTFESVIDKVLETRYWEKTLLSGKFDSAQVTLSFGIDDNVNEIKNLVIAEAENQTGKYISLGAANVTGDISKGNIQTSKAFSKSVLALAIKKDLSSKILYIPTALSPSALNDDDKVIKIYGGLLANDDFVFKVYNKWGNQAFESTSLDEMTTKGWNGTNYKTDLMESDGVYIFILKGKTITGSDYEKSGRVMILK